MSDKRREEIVQQLIVDAQQRCDGREFTIEDIAVDWILRLENEVKVFIGMASKGIDFENRLKRRIGELERENADLRADVKQYRHRWQGERDGRLVGQRTTNDEISALQNVRWHDPNRVAENERLRVVFENWDTFIAEDSLDDFIREMRDAIKGGE